MGRIVSKSMVNFICIDDKEYVLQVPLDEFYKDLGIKEQSSGAQHFAG